MRRASGCGSTHVVRSRPPESGSEPPLLVSGPELLLHRLVRFEFLQGGARGGVPGSGCGTEPAHGLVAIGKGAGLLAPFQQQPSKVYLSLGMTLTGRPAIPLDRDGH